MNGSESVARVAAVLAERGHPHVPRMLADSARTAQEAADAMPEPTLAPTNTPAPSRDSFLRA